MLDDEVKFSDTIKTIRLPTLLEDNFNYESWNISSINWLREYLVKFLILRFLI